MSYNPDPKQQQQPANSAPYPAPPPSYQQAMHTGRRGFAFNDKSIRRGFIRKVYLILSAQLAFTFGIVLLVSLVPALRQFARDHRWIAYIAYAVFIVVYIMLVCMMSLRRKYPWNMVALTVFTVALTFVAAVIAAQYSTNSTRIDFTLCSGLLFGLCLVVLLFGLACGITFAAYRGQPGDYLKLRILDCVYGGLVALLLTLFLIFDTQRVIGGRKYNLSEEEYVFGALQLYMDVVFIFPYYPRPGWGPLSY
uniref:MARVEL domain-containing protein n=1 Tax=Macrostomum lignano TaxID=282301 RepID=A0A1I8GQS5_9PLAT